jgi:dimethylhistidine N-methyltransferase
MDYNLQFAEDVREGLSSEPKHLHSKYFYDEVGDNLFQQIMTLDEYYLTDCELEIFNNQKDKILSCFSEGDEIFDLIEFGSGDGYKTKVLLEFFTQNRIQFKYIPVDISSSVLEILYNDLKINLPELDIHPVCDDYFHALEELNKVDFNKKVILFLGSNIGNFRGDNAIPFLKHLHADMRAGDQLFIGFDLKKDPQIILDAYNDKKGITREFNYNLLDRINKELGGNFDRNSFSHYPSYNPVTGETKSYLVSLKSQIISIDVLSQSFSFEKWEPVFMEVSQKYSLHNIRHLADHSGYKVKKNFFDSKKYFTDSLWILK